MKSQKVEEQEEYLRKLTVCSRFVLEREGGEKKSNQNHPQNIQRDEFSTSTTQNGSVDVDVYRRQHQLPLLKSRFNFLIKTAAGADE